MKHLLILILLYANLICIGCNGQPKPIKLSEVKFESIFGSSKDISCVYCLLGSGFFRAPRADNTDSLIKDWMYKHPNAILIPVSALKDKPKMVYCWLIDNRDTLNLMLIRNGCYPGGTMVGARKNTGINEVYISMPVYETFIKQLKAAETFARNNKLGIWVKENPFE